MADPDIEKIAPVTPDGLEKGKAKLALAGLQTGPEEVFFSKSIPTLSQIERMAARQKAIKEKSDKKNAARDRRQQARAQRGLGHAHAAR